MKVGQEVRPSYSQNHHRMVWFGRNLKEHLVPGITVFIIIFNPFQCLSGTCCSNLSPYSETQLNSKRPFWKSCP